MRQQAESMPISRGWAGMLLGTVALMSGLVVVRLGPRPGMVLAVALLYALFAVACVREPLVFVLAFLVVLEVLPPFYFTRFGDTPVYVSAFLLPIGLGVAFLRLPDFNLSLDPVAKGLGLFLLGTGISLPFGWWLSGSEVGIEGLFRWLLLCQTELIYVLIRGGARRRETRAERWMFRILLMAAVLSAAYAVYDFAWPVPLPHVAAVQRIWLKDAILRRAQGVFYESFSLANFCGFFLTVAAGAFLAKRERSIGLPRPLLLLSIAILGLAVLVAFARSAWASVLVSLLTFVAVSKQVKTRRGLALFILLSVPLAVLWMTSPELWSYFSTTRLGDLTQMFVDPDFASSGRVQVWSHLWRILQEQPQYLIFGIGYKTLPITRLFHAEIIADNGYLSLLLETGVVGLGTFLAFNVAIFRTFSRLLRSSSSGLAFWSGLLISFWCGECFQMLATDAYTFWRNMVVFIAVMALVMNRAERERAGSSPETVHHRVGLRKKEASQ